MRPKLPDYLGHIRQAARKARQYVEGMELSEFLENEFAQDAVMMTFIVMGEAASKIMNGYPDFVENHPEVPWYQMRGMRNRMAHGYFDINYEIVWETVHEWLPEILESLPDQSIESEDDDDLSYDDP